jgi:hypothetical protein
VDEAVTLQHMKIQVPTFSSTSRWAEKVMKAGKEITGSLSAFN